MNEHNRFISREVLTHKDCEPLRVVLRTLCETE